MVSVVNNRSECNSAIFLRWCSKASLSRESMGVTFCISGLSFVLAGR